MFGWNGVDNLSNFSPAVTFSRQPSRSAVVGVLCTPRRGAPPPLNPLVGLLTVRVFTNSIKKLSKFFTFIVLQKSFYIFLSVLCYLSRTWQPISSPPLFTLWKFQTIGGLGGRGDWAAVAGMSPRFCVPVSASNSFRGSITVAAAGQISGSAILGFPSTVFNFSETSWASFWELRGQQQQKIKLSMRTVHFRTVFKVSVEVSPEWFFLVNRGNHQLI